MAANPHELRFGNTTQPGLTIHIPAGHWRITDWWPPTPLLLEAQPWAKHMGIKRIRRDEDGMEIIVPKGAKLHGAGASRTHMRGDD